MAEHCTEFTYHNIELYKSESLGSGSYGGVCKAKCDGLLCAAKIMHPTLFDLRDPGTASYLRKFQEECHLLSLARHPNVVQYLGTCYDHDTRLPVLLMELCDESLTAFLEHSPEPLPYHTELNISHDIALALVYLHSNGLIHRDLTGNNVLMIAGTRAKITDFGMSKLATINSRMTTLTLCPGNILYMSPEALDEAKSYTANLDIFSFGVIAIQILTRQFPNPTDRFRRVYDARYAEEIRLVIPDVERRQSHLQLISDTHSLKPLAIQCLKKKENERPSVHHLSERLGELKLAPQYTESMQQTNSNIQQLQQQLQDQRILTETKTEEVRAHQARNTELQSVVEECRQTIEAKERLLGEKENTITMIMLQNEHEIQIKDRELQQTQDQLRATDRLASDLQQSIQQKEKIISDLQRSLQQKDKGLGDLQQSLQQKDEILSDLQQSLQQKDEALSDLQWSLQQKDKSLSDLQQSLQHKDNTISDLQQIVSGPERRKMRRLRHRQQDKVSRAQPRMHPFTTSTPAAAAAATLGACPVDISKMTWRHAKRAPEKMERGAAVVLGNIAYIKPGNSQKVYSYQNILGEERWTRLPDNPNRGCGLVIVDGLLTSVGGREKRYTNTLLSLTGEGERQQWSEIFPPMPTARHGTACITTGRTLVVAGGYVWPGDFLNTVEVMNINSKEWSTACPLPQRHVLVSGTVCGDTIYIAAGYNGPFPLNSVFYCSIHDLLNFKMPKSGAKETSSESGTRRGKHNAWNKVSSLPVTRFTLASFGGHLLAIGGTDDSDTSTNNVYKYDSFTDSWHVISHMKNRRAHSLGFTLPHNQLVVVGGSRNIVQTIDSVEIFRK